MPISFSNSHHAWEIAPVNAYGGSHSFRVWKPYLICIALVMPFLMLTQGFSGILGIAIIFFGLQRAWHKTKGDQGVLMGPYPAADLNPSVAGA